MLLWLVSAITAHGITEREFCIKKTVTLKDTHLICVSQTAQASY